MWNGFLDSCQARNETNRAHSLASGSEYSRTQHGCLKAMKFTDRFFTAIDLE